MSKWLKRTETAEALIALIERGWGWLVLGGLGSGGLFVGLAAATEWLNAYGPISWGIAGAFGVIVFVSVLAIWARFGLWSEQRRYAQIRIESPDPINPLDDTFERRRISINSLTSPFKEPCQNKTFIDCEIIGPGVVFFAGIYAENCSFSYCDPILVSDNTQVQNAVVFVNPTFRRCKLYQLTILVPEKAKADFEKIKGLRFINAP